MENQILDYFDNEKLPTSSLLFLNKNLVFGILLVLIGLVLIYSGYYRYDLQNSILVIISFPNYELLARLCFGVLLLHGGYRIIKKENLGIELIHVTAIGMVTYFLIVICFDYNFVLEVLQYVFISGILLVYSYWKKLVYLFPNISISSYLWLIGIIIGILPFIFFWEEIVR